MNEKISWLRVLIGRTEKKFSIYKSQIMKHIFLFPTSERLSWRLESKFWRNNKGIGNPFQGSFFRRIRKYGLDAIVP